MTNFEKVKAFMNTMGQTVLDKPDTVDDSIYNLRINLIAEEVKETFDAIALLRELNKLEEITSDFLEQLKVYGKVKCIYTDMFTQEEVIAELQREIADGLTDVLVVTYGAGAALGFNLDECFEEVHRSNMSKLDDNGNAIKRESDGKIMKGPNYSPPDLMKVIYKD